MSSQPWEPPKSVVLGCLTCRCPREVEVGSLVQTFCSWCGDGFVVVLDDAPRDVIA